MTMTVAIGGLGPVGLAVARALDGGMEGLQLAMVSAECRDHANTALRSFRMPPEIVEPARLAEADIIVEASSAALFEEIVMPAILAGRLLVVVSAAALLPRMHLVRRARERGGRILLPGGPLGALDTLRAFAEGPVESVTLTCRAAPFEIDGADSPSLAAPIRIFQGEALRAARAFPAYAHAVAAVAFAGIGPVRTKVEIWADPGLTSGSSYTIEAEAEAGRLTTVLAAGPAEDRMVPFSVLACLRGLTATLKAGS